MAPDQKPEIGGNHIVTIPLIIIALCLSLQYSSVEAKPVQKVVVSITESKCPREKLTNYVGYMEQELNNNWKIDSRATPVHTVKVLFAVHPGGEMSALQIRKSSSDRYADQAVLKTVENTNFKEPPAKCGDTITFEATFEVQK